MGRKNNRKTEYIPKLKTEQIVQPRRLEIWYAHLPMNRKTSVQGGGRPVVIISNDINNERSGTVTVLPMTSQMKHLEMPTHVVVEGILDEPSMILAEQIRTMDKKYLVRKIGDCAGLRGEIEDALLEQIGVQRWDI